MEKTQNTSVWEQFISEIFPDPESRESFRHIMGEGLGLSIAEGGKHHE